MVRTSRALAGAVFSFAVALVLAAAFAVMPAHAVTAAEKEAEAQEALNQLHAMQDTLEQKSAQYYQSLAEYQDAVTLRDAAQDRIDQISGEIKDIQSRLGHRARDMYRNGATSFIDMLFGAATFDEFTQNWDILNRLNDGDAKLSLQAKDLRSQVQVQEEEYAKQATVAEEKSQDAARAYKESQELVVKMQDAYDNLSAEAAQLYAEEQAAAAAAAAAAAQAAAEAAAAQAAAEAAQVQAAAQVDAAAAQGYDGAAQATQATGEAAAASQDYDEYEATAAAASASISGATGNDIVDRAYSMLGSTYRYGGTGADGTFDCSGLVGYAVTGTNERIGNTTTFMGYNQVSDPQPGDIVVSEGHTGIYIGDGQMIHAQDEDTGVVVGKVQSDMIYVRP